MYHTQTAVYCDRTNQRCCQVDRAQQRIIYGQLAQDGAGGMKFVPDASPAPQREGINTPLLSA